MVMGAIVRVAAPRRRPCGLGSPLTSKWPSQLNDRAIEANNTSLGSLDGRSLPSSSRPRISRGGKGRILYPTEGKWECQGGLPSLFFYTGKIFVVKGMGDILIIRRLDQARFDSCAPVYAVVLRDTPRPRTIPFFFQFQPHGFAAVFPTHASLFL